MTKRTALSPVTGDRLVSKLNTPEYEANFDAIFRKLQPIPTDSSEDEEHVDVEHD